MAPMRRCLGCRESLGKSEMLRLVVDSDGVIWPDLLQKAPGRGAYLCMRESCLNGMSDKRLMSLKSGFSVSLPQWHGLRQRIDENIKQHLAQLFSRARPRVEIGRDAVMHRLWNTAPQLVLLAGDAGDAVVRQLGDAVEKRKQAGFASSLVGVASRSWLGEMLGRECVAVAAMDASGRDAAMATKMEQYCAWHGRIKGSG
jgi:predicted RNA-binding protein YlxR (DUF448 family)